MSWIFFYYRAFKRVLTKEGWVKFPVFISVMLKEKIPSSIVIFWKLKISKFWWFSKIMPSCLRKILESFKHGLHNSPFALAGLEQYTIFMSELWFGTFVYCFNYQIFSKVRICFEKRNATLGKDLYAQFCSQKTRVENFISWRTKKAKENANGIFNIRKGLFSLKPTLLSYI